MPPTHPFARQSRWRFAFILAFSVLGALFLAAASLFVIAYPMVGLRTIAKFDGAKATDLLAALVAMPLFVGLFVGLGSLCRRVVWRLVRVSLMALQAADPRPPVVFLRAFGDDQIPLRNSKAPLLARLLEAGRRRITLDRLLLEEATAFGPVVGLGNPNDKFPPYGAARGYFEDKTWRGAVTDLVYRSGAVVICLDDTDGVWWEVELLNSDGYLGKTLFLLPPKYADREANFKIVNKLLNLLPPSKGDADVLLAEPPQPSRRNRSSETLIGFFRDASGVLHVIRSATHTQYAYLLTVRLFLRQLPNLQA